MPAERELPCPNVSHTRVQQIKRQAIASLQRILKE